MFTASKSNLTEDETSCNYCQKTFSSAAKATHHEKVVHLGLYVTNCEFCGKQFNEALKTKEHQRKKHTKQFEGKSVAPAMSIRVLNVGNFFMSRKHCQSCQTDT